MRDSGVIEETQAPKPADERSGIRNTVLVSTMVATAFQIFVVSVLARVLIDDFGLSRFELGLIGSLNTAVGALTAPLSGRVTDRIGARESTIVAQLWTALGFVVMATAHSVPHLIVSAIVLGIPQGWGNPATNALIAERVSAGRRGVVTGIKQSGVQLGIFLAGATLPALSDWIGWRGAMWFYASVFAAFALLPFLLPRQSTDAPDALDPAASTANAPRSRPAKAEPAIPYAGRAVALIALYAFLMGTGGGAIGRFLALFAEEEVGLSLSAAGAVLAVSGLAGMVARVIAGQLAEHRIAPLRLLSILASVGAFVAVLLSLTLTLGAWLLWPIALLFAIGHAAWNAVAMLAIILGVDRTQAGRASGTVMFGFLGGLAVGAPIAGLVIDATDSYQLVWFGALGLAVASSIVARFAHQFSLAAD